MRPMRFPALDAGANDYVTKPFRRILLARMRAQLRSYEQAETAELQQFYFSPQFENIGAARRRGKNSLDRKRN